MLTVLKGDEQQWGVVAVGARGCDTQRDAAVAQNASRISTNRTFMSYRTGRVSCVWLRLNGTLDDYADTLAKRIDRGEFP